MHPRREPAWLLDGLAKMHAAGWQAGGAAEPFFLKGETLQPVTRLLEKIQGGERGLLLAVSASAAAARAEPDGARAARPARARAIDHEHVAIISARLERLEALRAGCSC